MVDLDSPLSQELLEVAVGQSVPQVPADGEEDDRRREPKASKCRARLLNRSNGVVVHHAGSLVQPGHGHESGLGWIRLRSVQQCPSWCLQSSRPTFGTTTTNTPRPTGWIRGCWLVCPCCTQRVCGASTISVRPSHCAAPCVTAPAWSSAAAPPVFASMHSSSCSVRGGPIASDRQPPRSRRWSSWRNTPIHGLSSV